MCRKLPFNGASLNEVHQVYGVLFQNQCLEANSRCAFHVHVANDTNRLGCLDTAAERHRSGRPITLGQKRELTALKNLATIWLTYEHCIEIPEWC